MKPMDPETNVMRTLLVDAPPEMVWKALTEPDLTKLYMGAILKSDLHTTVDLHLIEEDGGRTRVELWQGDFAGLPLATRRTRELGKQWVEQLVGLKRVSEELAQAKAA